MIAAVTYSTENFEFMRKQNVYSAYNKGGADIVFEFSDNDIDDQFKTTNSKILSYKRGAGLWLWKPYVIDKALSEISDGDFLIYSDAGSLYINKIQYLVDVLEASNQDIMVFELPLLSKQWTKKETFVRLHADRNDIEHENQILANFILLKKSKNSIGFIKEYLRSCCDEVALSSTQFDDSIINPTIFLEHREDQSILSILSIKHGLIPFRDPSQYGERPWEYLLSNEVIYKPRNYTNSNFPTIFLLTRNEVRYKIFKLKNYVKKILSLFSVYIKWEIRRRQKISKQYNI